MTNSNPVHRIYRIALVVALCVTFMGVALLFTEKFESVAPAQEIPRSSCCYGTLPPVW
jgi:hypothetical protein